MTEYVRERVPFVSDVLSVPFSVGVLFGACAGLAFLLSLV